MRRVRARRGVAWWAAHAVFLLACGVAFLGALWLAGRIAHEAWDVLHAGWESHR